LIRRPGPEERFDVDPDTGRLLYRGGDGCTSQTVPCLSLCPDVFSHDTLEGVLAAGAQTFSDDWSLDERGLASVFGLPPPTTHSPYERGAKGKWRPRSSFGYRTSVGSANTTDGRVHADAGVFDDFTLFDFAHAAANDAEKWLATSTATAYSPHGQPIEERDLDDVATAAKLGYRHTVPYLVASNTDYESVAFESFEFVYPRAGGGEQLEDGLPHDPARAVVDDAVAHAGRRSLRLRVDRRLGGGFARRVRFPVSLTPALRSDGLSVKVWARSSDPRHTLDGELVLRLLATDPADVTARASKPFTRVARTGEWVLLGATLLPGELAAAAAGRRHALEIQHTNEANSELWIDDLRWQPASAAVTAYVYDARTLRLLTRFGDDHFGESFQYDGEGRLVRRILETEHGPKTIDEAAYHTPSVSRFEE
jgi:hypothetical protein